MRRFNLLQLLLMLRKLIYRRGAIGDIIHCLPAIKLLRKLEPGSRIDLVVGTEQIRSMLSVAAPYIDHIYVAGKKLAEATELVASFKTSPVDEFIYLHSGFWKAWYYQQTLVRARKLSCYKKDTQLGARENFALTMFPGLRAELLAKQFTNEIYKLLDYKCLEAPSHRTTAIGLGQGICERGSGVDVGVNEHAERANNAEISQSSKSGYICIVPGVGHLRPSRAYPLDYWLEIISELLRKTDLEIKILGGPDEEEMSHELFIALAAEAKTMKLEAERRQQSIPNPEARLTNLVGKTSLVDLLAIFKNTELVLSGDTGLLHIATAVGARAVSIYTVTSELRTGPHSPLAAVLRSHSCACNPSFKNKGNEMKHCAVPKNGYASCVWDISSAELLRKCYDSTTLKTR